MTPGLTLSGKGAAALCVRLRGCDAYHVRSTDDMKMRTRIIWCSVFGLGWLVCTFIPVWSPERGVFLTFPPVLFITLPVVIGLPLFTIYSLVGVFTQWKTHKARAFIPFALCICFFLLASVANRAGFRIRMKTFRENLPMFEEKAMSVVEELQTDVADGKELKQPHHAGTFNLPHLGRPYMVYAELETNGVATVRFTLIVTINLHHRGYMYRSDGNFKAALKDWEHIQEQINEHWCAVAD